MVYSGTAQDVEIVEEDEHLRENLNGQVE